MRREPWAVMALALLVAEPAAALGICVEGNYPPFSEVLDDGTIVGFDIDIAEALCARIDETCTMVLTSWERMIPALTGGSCDAIVASMSDTAERRQEIAFTDRYYKAPVRFVGRSGMEGGDAPEGLAGKVVGVQRGTIHEAFMQGEFPEVTLQPYGTQDEMVLDLTSGRLDAVMADSVALDLGFLKTPGGADYAFFGEPYLDPKYHGEGAGIGVRKEDTELRDKLSAAIDAIRASGEYATIQKKYFEYDVYGG